MTQLVQTVTEDGLRLDGVLDRADPSVHDRPVDVLLCLHGAGGNFYNFGTVAGALPDWLQSGVSLLRVNTRGHDQLYATRDANGPCWQGAAREIVDHCRLDVAAWCAELKRLGFERIGLLGHSLGAIKAVYAQAHEPSDLVKRVIAVSPPRLSHQQFEYSRFSGQHLGYVAEARRLVKEGKHETLMRVEFPLPMLIAAEIYLDKYGPGERYNFLRFLDSIPVPLLFVYGAMELEDDGPAFADLPDAIRSAQRDDQAVEVMTIPGADHFYRQKQSELAASIVQWLNG